MTPVAAVCHSPLYGQVYDAQDCHCFCCMFVTRLDVDEIETLVRSSRVSDLVEGEIAQCRCSEIVYPEAYSASLRRRCWVTCA